MNKAPNAFLNEEGSALATVLVISVIISLFIGIVLSGMVIQFRFIQKDINSTKALYAAEEAIYLFLLNNKAVMPVGNTTATLGDEKEVELYAHPFGGFLDITSQAAVSGQKRKIRVLVGDKSGRIYRHAIALGDSTHDLTLTGNTTITGDIITYNQGLDLESFRGIPYRGNFEGERNTFKADTTFPKFNSEHFSMQEGIYNDLFGNSRMRVFESTYSGSGNTSGIMKRDTLFFSKDTEWISNFPVHFPGDNVIIVDGNFLINGDYQFGPFTKILVRDTLLVGGSVSGSELLFYAGKELQIGGGTSVNVQAMSGGNVVVRDVAYLNYPSLVYSSKEFYQGGAREVIRIRNNAVVDGTVLYPFQPSAFSQTLFRVRVDTNATVRGSIYTRGQTELEGTVLGSVFTNQFYFYDSPTEYVNWVKDAVIDVSRRSTNYILPIGFSDSSRYEIVNWFEVREE